VRAPDDDYSAPGTDESESDLDLAPTSESDADVGADSDESLDIDAIKGRAPAVRKKPVAPAARKRKPAGVSPRTPQNIQGRRTNRTFTAGGLVRGSCLCVCVCV